MRHPHPLVYVLALGFPILFGLVAGVQVWTTSEPSDPFALSLAKSFAAMVAPLLIVLVGLLGLAAIMLHLETLRVGNRVQITGGEHVGKIADITKRHGFTTTDWVHVRLIEDGLETTISPYQIRKIGLRSRIL